MHEFELIKNYFQKLSKKSPSALNLNDDVFFDKNNFLLIQIHALVVLIFLAILSNIAFKYLV